MRTRRTSAATTTVTLIVFLAAVWTGAAVHIPTGGYLYADHHDDLMMTPDGITVEGWFYLDAYPPEGTFRASLIAKPGSYAIDLAERPRRGRARVVDLGPFVELEFWDIETTRVVGGQRFGVMFHGRGVLPDPVSAAKWMHVALEMRDPPGKIYDS